MFAIFNVLRRVSISGLVESKLWGQTSIYPSHELLGHAAARNTPMDQATAFLFSLALG